MSNSSPLFSWTPSPCHTPHASGQSSVLSPQSIPICSSRAGGHTLGAFGLVCMTGQSLTSLRSLLKCHLLTQAFSDLLLKTSTHPHPHESPSSFTQIYHISPKYVTYFVLSIFPQWTEVPMRAGTLSMYSLLYPQHPAQHSTGYVTGTLYKLVE